MPKYICPLTPTHTTHMTRYIKIDPLNQSVTEVYGKGLEFLYREMRCEIVQVVPADTARTIDIWVDEEGLLNGCLERNGAVKLNCFPGLLVGVVLLSGGVDAEGETIGSDLTIGEAQKFIKTWFAPPHPATNHHHEEDDPEGTAHEKEHDPATGG